MSQSLILPSQLPDNTRWPSGEKATAEIPARCPMKERNTVPVLTSHMARIVPRPIEKKSPLPVSAYLPSGEKAAANTESP